MLCLLSGMILIGLGNVGGAGVVRRGHGPAEGVCREGKTLGKGKISLIPSYPTQEDTTVGLDDHEIHTVD